MKNVSLFCRHSYLKVCCITIASYCMCFVANAQTRPDAEPFPANAKINFVRSWTASRPITSPQDIINNSSHREVQMTTEYMDGLGRPLQTVVRKASLNTGAGHTEPVDMVQAKQYDAFGRERFQLLPFAAIDQGGNGSISDGECKYNPVVQDYYFYGSDNSPIRNQIMGYDYLYHYSKTNFEASPLNRPVEAFAPGFNGAGSESRPWDIKSTKFKYFINTLTDDVKIWNVTEVANTMGSYSIAGAYAAGELYKNVTVDEKGSQVIEFKDKEGKTILKKVQLTAAADDGTGSGYPGWLCTYYVYDDLGLLRMVLPPKATEELANTSWPAISSTILNELCFRYQYDKRNRMAVKKIPGAGETWMVYDDRDRLVMTQDANLRSADEWLVTRYDELNRPIATYKWNDAYTRDDHELWADGIAQYPSSSSFSSMDLLTETHYDDYGSLPTGLTGSLVSGYSGSFITSFNTAPDYARPVAQFTHTIGMVTWTKARVLGTNQFTSSCMIYDDRGRPIQVQSVNHAGGIDVTTTQYDFSGKPLRTHTMHHNPGATPASVETETKYTYDGLGRMALTEKNINGTGWKTIVSMTYDALGQVKTKSVGTKPGTTNTPLETLANDYNIRGWLLGTNRDFTRAHNNTANYFGFELGYDRPVFNNGGGSLANAQYNGNIGAMGWKSIGDNVIRKYDFTYDNADRLTSADFNQNPGSAWDKSFVDFSVSNLTYDANGNIKTMDQKGFKITGTSIGSSFIDQLNYSYLNSGLSNRLQAVTDAQNDHTSKLGDFKYNSSTKTTTDYSYDLNGNMYADKNKDIGNIAYNYLNLPQTVTVTGKGTITYTYDAAGNKLKKTTVDNTTSPAKTTVTEYIGGYVYEKVDANPSTLQFFGHEEGRVRRKTDGSYVLDYFLKDHLGNVRMVLTEEQEMAGYPKLSYDNTPQSIADQDAYWDNSAGQSIDVNTVRTNKPGTSGDHAQLLRKSTGSIGATKILKVMSGDNVHVKVDYVYTGTSADNSTADGKNAAINSLLNGLLYGGAVPSTIKAGATPITSQLTSDPGVGNFFNGQNPDHTTNQPPKAYLHVLLFDEQFKFDDVNSYVGQVTSSQTGTIDRYLTPVQIKKNGYAYIYISNESDAMVYFDNLELVHEKGPLLEETHYYPFGLTMSGISSKAAGSLENKYKFGDKELQSTEFSDNSGLELYDFSARFFDPQVGRWLNSDPLADKFTHQSNYCAMDNNPIVKVDPTGMEAISTAPIYDQSGALLGTDNQGLQGKAIVMDKKDFKQNMSHEDALSKNLGVEGLKNDKAISNFNQNYYSLSGRPDYDGYVTKSEADNWYRGGSGGSLYVDVSKINLPGIHTGMLTVGSTESINFGLPAPIENTGRVFGRLDVTLLNDITGEVQIGYKVLLPGNSALVLDRYDFRMNEGQHVRNFFTEVGSPGNGREFQFHGYGKNTSIPVHDKYHNLLRGK